MIIDTKPQHLVESSGDLETTTFSIETSAKAFVVLSSSLYKDKLRSIIRELSCNSRDAHVESKNLNTFDVHLPNALEPEFWIRDYGTGLSDDNIKNVYTRYFKSTKEKTNEAVGCLGLGSKSPFAYTSSFMVTSWFGGKQIIYSVFINDQSEPSIAKMMEVESDAPNGLEVRFNVPVEDAYKVQVAARQVYKWFNDIKPNFIGGSFDLGIDKIKKVGKFYFENSRSGYTPTVNISILMGGVEYPVDTKNATVLGIESIQDIMKMNHGASCSCLTVSIDVPIGAVDFTPSREELQYTKKTLDAINNLFNDATSDLKKSVSRFSASDIKGKSYVEAAKIASKKIEEIKEQAKNLGVSDSFFQSRQSIMAILQKNFDKEIEAASKYIISIGDKYSDSKLFEAASSGITLIVSDVSNIGIAEFVKANPNSKGAIVKEKGYGGANKLIKEVDTAKDAFVALGFNVVLASEILNVELKDRKYSTGYQLFATLSDKSYNSASITMRALKPIQLENLIKGIDSSDNVYFVSMKNKKMENESSINSLVELAEHVGFTYTAIGVYQPTRVDISKMKDFHEHFQKDLDCWMASAPNRNPFIIGRILTAEKTQTNVPDDIMRYVVGTIGLSQTPSFKEIRKEIFNTRLSGANQYSTRRSENFFNYLINHKDFPLAYMKDETLYQVDTDVVEIIREMGEIVPQIVAALNRKNRIFSSYSMKCSDPALQKKFDDQVRSIYNLIIEAGNTQPN